MPPLPKNLVGAPGFEPGTFCTPSKRATSLRYAPSKNAHGLPHQPRPRNKKNLPPPLPWIAAITASAIVCCAPSSGLADAVYVLVGLYGFAHLHRLRNAWAHPFGLFALLGLLWMIATCAWSFDPNGTLRDLMGDLPLLFAVIGLPALITTRRRAWTGLALAAAFLSLRLGLNLLRLSTILGLGAPLLQQARFTHPYVYTHPNAACMLAGLSLFVYAALLLRKNAWHHARFLFPLLGAALSALYLFVLASRGPQATIGLLALLAPLLLLPGWRPRLLALLLCTTTAAALWQLKDHINPRFADATMQGFNNRAIVWQHVSFLPRTQHRQWQGFGFGKRAFHKAYYENPHQRPPWVPGDTLRFPHAHSYWLMIRFEGGWIALALWSLAWLALLLRVIRTIRRDARATQPQHFLPLLRARLLPSLPALALAAILLYGLWDYPDSFLRDVQFLLLSLLAALTALPPQEILHEN